MGDLDLYQKFYDAFLKGTPLSKAEAQVAVVKLWNDSKREFKDDKEGFENLILSKIEEYTEEANEIINNHSIFNAPSPEMRVEVVTQISEDEEEYCPSTSSTFNASGIENSHLEDNTRCSVSGMIITGAHAQSKVANEIAVIQAELKSLYDKRYLRSLSEEESNEVKKNEEALRVKVKELRKLEQGQRRQMKYREKRKLEMSNLLENHPELKQEIPSLNEKRGRPRLRNDQSHLIKTIAEIAFQRNSNSTEVKRISESIKNAKTMEKLTDELMKSGISVSQNGVYVRLTEKANSLTQGKKHIKTVPVKLTKANSNIMTHQDEKFCMASLEHLKELASLLGPNQVFMFSQNTKARISIELSAAHEEAPLLMQLDYKAILPDEWVVSPQHKLVPSVYSGIVMKENCYDHSNAITFSGPTYIAIRSSKSSPPTAFSLATDLQTILEQPEFEKLGKLFEGGPSKPVFIIFVDGGPDENPRYEKVIETAIHNFLEYNLDALFIATNAPGRSAFDQVERRLAPLGRELNGVILPNEIYGSHLDENGKTIDDDLAKINFQSAGEALTEIWAPIVLDGYTVSSTYISPDMAVDSSSCLSQKDMIWRSKHVIEGQYFTQIVKCFDNSCCTSTRSDYFKIVPKRFLPPPLPLIQTSSGLGCPEFPIANPDNQTYVFPSLFVNLSMNGDAMLPLAARSFKRIPYDLYCPTTQSQLLKRICKKCSLYHSSAIRLATHMKNVCFDNEVIVPTVRPLCLVARRNEEILALLTDNTDLEWVNEEDAEWDLAMEDDIVASINSSAITTVKRHISNPWENK